MGFEPIFLHRKRNVLTIRRKSLFFLKPRIGLEPISDDYKTSALPIKLTVFE